MRMCLNNESGDSSDDIPLVDNPEFRCLNRMKEFVVGACAKTNDAQIRGKANKSSGSKADRTLRRTNAWI